MNKSKIIMYTTIGVMSLILVYVMFIQFRIVNESDVDEVKFLREAELREMLASYKEKYKEVEEEIIETDKTIEEYKQTAKTEEGTIALLEKDRDDARMKLGITDVEGEGITIKMVEPRGTETAPVEPYSNLLTLVNELLLAGAEAISINGQRIVAMSDIVSISGDIIRINGERTTDPFEIKAIGETDRLLSALRIKGGFMDMYNDINYTITIEKGNVKINKYSQPITLEYANK